jgi:hypothetical protein
VSASFLAPASAAHLAASPGMGLSPLPPVVGWCCAAVLLALAARSGARLVSDRAPVDRSVPGCAVTSRAGDGVHLAAAAGMAAMLLPLGLPAAALTAYFSATTAFVAGTWLTRVVRGRLSSRRGAAVPCRPAHALEPHHVIVGLTMIVMAARMNGAVPSPAGMPGMPGMAGMAGMAASPGWLGLGTLSLVYVWGAALFLGGGLAKAVSARPAPASGTLAVLAAPVTVYACEITMTVVMGLMLLG